MIKRLANQMEITQRMELLDENGNLKQCGYARSLLPIYDRSKIKANSLRIKEWDYYYVGNDSFGVALTIADNSYMGLDSISFLSFSDKPWEITKSPMKAFPMGKTGLPATSEEGFTESAGKGYAIQFAVYGGKRHLIAHMDKFRGDEAIDIDIYLRETAEDSMVICTPFDKAGHFYFNQKINCMHATGIVKLGRDTYELKEGEAFGLLDWGRGVWTYHNTWYWGSASGLVDGVDLGFNIGYGFGDTRAASENMLFYNGKAHKLSEVEFNIPVGENGREQYEKPWTFTSDDGRFNMDFVPVIDRASCTDVKLIKSNQHQVFGKFTGTAVLDDGSCISVKDFFGFAEKVENKW